MRSAWLAFCAPFAAWLVTAADFSADWKSQGVIYLDHSLNARLHTVPVSAVHVDGGFWAARRKVTTERSLPTLLDLLEEHGVFDNLRRLSGRKNVPRPGGVSADADACK